MPTYLKRLTAFLFAILLTCAAGQQFSSPAFAPAPQQPAYAAKLQAYLQVQMNAYKIPGMAVAIVRDGETQYLQGLGVANARGDPVTAETPFLIASLSKSITAVAVMQLVEAGKLRLDDPVQKYLPWFSVAGRNAADITVADLLYQTSGFTEMGGLQTNLKPDSPDGLEAGVRDLATERLGFDPGEGWEYSNLNYNVLGLLIQQISGQRYEDYIAEHIFTPLQMRHSYLSIAEARAAGAASGYYPFFGFPLVSDRIMPYSHATLPAAGVWSTASDISRYLTAHLNGGQLDGAAILSAEGIQKTHQPGYNFNDVQGYAMGWTSNRGFMSRELLEPLETELKNYETLTVLFHEGDWTGYKSVAFMIPEINFGLVLLMNTNDPTITSAFRFFAWDVSLIATGGEAQYFPPSESFLVRHSRWIFTGIVLFLAGGLLSSSQALKKLPKGGALTGRGRLLQAALPLGLLIALNAYLSFKFLPDNNANLAILSRFAPDLALLFGLLMLLSAAWAVVCVVMLVARRL